MPANNISYEKIRSKIHAMKGTYPSLPTKRDDYVFSALCVKSHHFKSPPARVQNIPTSLRS